MMAVPKSAQYLLIVVGNQQPNLVSTEIMRAKRMTAGLVGFLSNSSYGWNFSWNTDLLRVASGH
jgi:hypothetical protein